MLKESLWNLDLDNILEHEQEAYINRKRGMVRVSLSLYNTEEDINFLISALGEIDEKIATLKENYFAINNGSYQHKSFTFDWNEYLKL